MLRQVMRHNLVAAAPYYAELAEALGLLPDARVLIDHLDGLMRASGLPLTLGSVGVSHNRIPLLASEAMKQQRLLVNNPVPITEADAVRLYEAAC
jgi:alcohol dehydrogenase